MRCKRSALALMNNTAIVSLYISRPLLSPSLHPPFLSLSRYFSRARMRAHTARNREGGRESGREGGREANRSESAWKNSFHEPAGPHLELPAYVTDYSHKRCICQQHVSPFLTCNRMCHSTCYRYSHMSQLMASYFT